MKRHWLLTIAGSLLLGSCAVNKPNEPKGTFSVKVVPYFGKDVHVYITVYEQVNGGNGPAINSHRVTGDGVSGFLLPLGKEYGVRAYADLDGDRKAGAGDPSASIGGLKPEADVNVQHPPVILTLPGTGEAPDWPHGKGTNANDNSDAPPAAEAKKGPAQNHDAAPSPPVPPPPVPPPPQ